jgi:two-component system response regulator EvgA
MRRRVLIIDDNPTFRATVRELLDREGFDVVAEAGTGVAGIRAAREHRPDLVLVDVQLPDFDGFEVAERLARLALRARVILTSSLDDTDYGGLVSGSPAVGFIAKSELSAASIEALLGA